MFDNNLALGYSISVMRTQAPTSKAAALLGSITTESKATAARNNGKLGGRPLTLTGGRAGFVNAIDEAFRSNAINPKIRYSHARGFHVESGIHPADDDVLWSASTNYIIPSGRRSVRPTDYTEIRAAIMAE